MHEKHTKQKASVCEVKNPVKNDFQIIFTEKYSNTKR